MCGFSIESEPLFLKIPNNLLFLIAPYPWLPATERDGDSVVQELTKDVSIAMVKEILEL
jgi:hypothetical protein